MSYNIQKYSPKELATKAVMHALMKADIKVHLATPEMFAKDMTVHRSNIEMQISNKRILYLKRLVGNINKWIYDNNPKAKLSFSLKLPYTTENNIFKVTGKRIKNHKISSDSFLHILKGHGEKGIKNNAKSIPIRREYMSLIPYILTAPDKISMGSIDSKGCASIKYTKSLSNGMVLVVEKENKNNPLVMETVTMWAELESNVSDARNLRPLNSTSETVTIGSSDIAKIIKDAENAIREDVKNQIDKQINYFYALENDNTTMTIDDMADDLVVPCRNNGTLYGWTFNENIYLTPEGINPETPVHEYTHLWSGAMMVQNPEQWEFIKTLLMDSEEWGKVVEDPLYTSISDDEDRVASETLARLSGQYNQGLLVHYAGDTLNRNTRVDERSLVNKLLDTTLTALKQFWGWVGKNIFHIPELQSIRQVTDKVLYDLVSSTTLEQPEIMMDKPQFSITTGNENRISDIEIKSHGIGYAIRCRLDGTNQPSKSITLAEYLKYEKLRQGGDDGELDNYKTRLAERYFILRPEEQVQNKGRGI